MTPCFSIFFWKLQSGKATQVGNTFLWNFFYFFSLSFMTKPGAYGSSWDRGWIGAAAASLHHSHSNEGFRWHLRPTPQLMATLDPQSTEWGQGWNANPHGYSLGSFLLSHNGNSLFGISCYREFSNLLWRFHQASPCENLDPQCDEVAACCSSGKLE